MSDRQTAKQRTRRALVNAGVELISAQGIDGPSLDAICEHAGYTRGAFYVHFSDRDDFLVAVMEQVGRPVLDALLAESEGDDLGALAQRFAHAFVDGRYPLGPGGAVRPHQLLQACARSERVRAMYVSLVSDAIARMGAAVKRSQHRESVRADVAADEVASLLMAIIIGAQTMVDLGAPLDLAALTRSVMMLLSPSG
jgi:AcrR family transcriptional regulator